MDQNPLDVINALMNNSVTNTVTLGSILEILCEKGLMTKEELQARVALNVKKYTEEAKKKSAEAASQIIVPNTVL